MNIEQLKETVKAFEEITDNKLRFYEMLCKIKRECMKNKMVHEVLKINELLETLSLEINIVGEQVKKINFNLGINYDNTQTNS